jgi:hypothetical protein
MRQPLDIVYQAVKLTLRVHFLSPAQREAIQPLVVTDIAEHRRHRGKALPRQACAIGRLPTIPRE